MSQSPKGVTGLDWWAFAGCSGQTNVSLPNSLTVIGHEAFPGGTGITSLTIPDSVAYIGRNAFRGFSGLTSITIPKSVNIIWEGAFRDCPKLTNSFFEGNAPETFEDDVFDSSTTAYYLPGTTEWRPSFSGCPTAPWVRPNPTILDFGDRFGPTTNGFSFPISWATNVPVVVEASADLSGGGWSPISTNTLTDGWVKFTDPEWQNQPARFYRVRGE